MTESSKQTGVYAAELNQLLDKMDQIEIRLQRIYECLEDTIDVSLMQIAAAISEHP